MVFGREGSSFGVEVVKHPHMRLVAIFQRDWRQNGNQMAIARWWRGRRPAGHQFGMVGWMSCVDPFEDLSIFLSEQVKTPFDLRSCLGGTKNTFAIVEMSDRGPFLIEVLHVPGRVAVVKMVAMLQLVGKTNVKIGTAVNAFDSAHVTIDLNHHAESSKLDTAAADHLLLELFRLTFLC